MKRFFLLCSASALLALPAQLRAQAKLVEKIEKKGPGIVIPYEKYRLPNGLTLIVHEDHSDPIVHVDVTYHVGSAREQVGKSGFAHFFEHMMFQGSDNVADEQHFKIITESGGVLNGTTNRDRTNYFETVPSNQLEKMLWLEADRMGFLLDAVTQKKFEVQRATVKNERGQNYDNRPYGLVGEVTARNLYSYGHPYSWLTIGYIEDLNRVDVNDLKNFFLRWYGPNNAVVTVGGDVKAAEVVKLVEKYFGSIPKGPEVKPVKLSMPVLEQDRYISMKDNYAKLPMLRVVFPTTPQYDKDEAALDCLAEILGQGNNSILYQNLVKTQKAVNSTAYNATSELAGEFTISVTPFPGQKLADIEKMVRAAIEEFGKRGPTDDEISKFRNQQESGGIYGLESVSAKVSKLAAFETFTGNPNYIGKEIKRYTSVTKEDVMRVYNQYVKGKHAVIVSVVTKGQEDNLAAADNYKPDTTKYNAPDYGYDKLKYVKAKDNFDRKAMPGAGANPVVKAPAYWSQPMLGASQIIGAQMNELPVVNVSIEINGGKMVEARDLSKLGISNLFAAMMEEDTKNYTAEQFTTELQKLGSDISFGVFDDAVYINVRCLKKNLHPTMALLEEKMLHPVFKEETFNSIKNRTIESIRNAMNQPSYIASTVFDKINYGKDNIMGCPTRGTEKTLQNITLKDIENYYKDNFTFSFAKVVVVGDVSQEEMVKELSFTSRMPMKPVWLPQLPAAPKVEKTKIYFVNVPNAAQTEFRIGYVTDLKYDALGEYYRTTVMNYPFGAAFNSRLNLDLREDKGWTYGARAYFMGDKYTGLYQFSAGIKASATDSALRDVLQITREYREKGMTQDELIFTQNSMGQSEARKYETGFQKAAYLSRIITYRLQPDFSEKQNELLKKTTTYELNQLAGRHLPDVDKMNIVLVGDKAKVLDGLKNIGYDVVELDKDGNVLE